MRPPGPSNAQSLTREEKKVPKHRDTMMDPNITVSFTRRHMCCARRRGFAADSILTTSSKSQEMTADIGLFEAVWP
jgi:hypothetical protein